MTSRDRWLGPLCAALVLCIWTAFIVLSRMGVRGQLTPYDVAFLRFSVSGALLAAWALRRGQLGALLLGAPARAATLGICAGIGYCLLAYNAFRFAPAAHGGCLMPGTLPLSAALAAWLLLGDRPPAARWMGFALILAGDLTVGGNSLVHALDGARVWIGDLLFLVAGACWACYTVLCRRWRLGPREATTMVGLFTLCAYVPPYAVGALAGWWPTGLAVAPAREIIGQALFQGVVAMVVSGLAFTKVLQVYGPVRTTLLTALVPGLAGLVAIPLLGEPLSANLVAGIGLVSAGLALAVRGAPLGGPAGAVAR